MTNQIAYRRVWRHVRLREKGALKAYRRQTNDNARCLVAAALRQQPNTNQESIASMLNTTQGTISKMLRKHERLLKVDETYKEAWESLMDNMRVIG